MSPKLMPQDAAATRGAMATQVRNQSAEGSNDDRCQKNYQRRSSQMPLSDGSTFLPSIQVASRTCLSLLVLWPHAAGRQGARATRAKAVSADLEANLSARHGRACPAQASLDIRPG
jgi:hypothetical protein